MVSSRHPSVHPPPVQRADLLTLGIRSGMQLSLRCPWMARLIVDTADHRQSHLLRQRKSRTYRRLPIISPHCKWDPFLSQGFFLTQTRDWVCRLENCSDGWMDGQSGVWSEAVIRKLIECIATAAVLQCCGAGGGGIHFSSPSQVFINHSIRHGVVGVVVGNGVCEGLPKSPREKDQRMGCQRGAINCKKTSQKKSRNSLTSCCKTIPLVHCLSISFAQSPFGWVLKKIWPPDNEDDRPMTCSKE